MKPISNISLLLSIFLIAFSACTKETELLKESAISPLENPNDSIDVNATTIDSTLTNLPPNNPSNASSYVFEEPQVTGNTFYLDPVNGSINGDGSQNNPWSGLQEVVEGKLIETYKHSENNNSNSPLVVLNEGAPIKGGDRLILKDGYHGQLEINNFYFDEWLTIQGAAGENPVLARLHLTGLTKNVYLKNINFLRESYQGAESYWQASNMQRNSRAILNIASHSFFGNASDVKINGCTIKTAENVDNWSRQDWEDRYGSGIILRASENIEIVNSHFENIGFGAVADYFANKTTIVNSTFKNYCRDGVRLTAHDFYFENNEILGVVNINLTYDIGVNFHYDAFQTFSRDPNNSSNIGTTTLRNAVIRGNLIVGKSDLPLSNGFIVKEDAQGIGGFDGFFDNFIIENNVVSVSHHHAITFLGATNTIIANNTVIDPDPKDDLHPWIRVNNHKDGRPSSDCAVVNNIVYEGVHIEGEAMSKNNNHIIGVGNQNEFYSLFVDPENNDLHLLNNSTVDQTIIDAGDIFDNLHSSKTDKDGNPRFANPDLGAYERID